MWVGWWVGRWREREIERERKKEKKQGSVCLLVHAIQSVRSVSCGDGNVARTAEIDVRTCCHQIVWVCMAYDLCVMQGWGQGVFVHMAYGS